MPIQREQRVDNTSNQRGSMLVSKECRNPVLRRFGDDFMDALLYVEKFMDVWNV
jgi:hypothetical protein